jgi:hypothetical protein
MDYIVPRTYAHLHNVLAPNGQGSYLSKPLAPVVSKREYSRSQIILDNIDPLLQCSECHSLTSVVADSGVIFDKQLRFKENMQYVVKKGTKLAHKHEVSTPA